MQYFIGLLLVMASLHYGGDYIHFQWFIGASILATPIALLGYIFYRRGKGRTVAIVYPAIAYLIVNATYISTFRHNRFSANTVDIKSYFAYLADDHIFYTMLLFIGVYLYSILSDPKHILRALGWWGLVNSIYTIDGYIRGYGLLPMGVGYSGFINYASVNSSLIAVTLPFWPWAKTRHKFIKDLVLLIVAIIAIYLSKSSIPIGTMLVVFFFYKVCDHKLSEQVQWSSLRLVAASMALTIIGVILAISRYFDKTLFDSGYRFHAYKIFMTFWFHKANIFFGFGPGSYLPLAKDIQILNKFMIHDQGQSFIWLQLHNEWLELALFNNGLVGLGLALAITASVTYTFIKHKKHQELSSFMGLCACSLFNFPLHYFFGAFALTILIVSAIRLEGDEHELVNMR